MYDIYKRYIEWIWTGILKHACNLVSLFLLIKYNNKT